MTSQEYHSVILGFLIVFVFAVAFIVIFQNRVKIEKLRKKNFSWYKQTYPIEPAAIC